LSNCISALAEQKKGLHIPFRESKLTRILADSLTGNSITTFLACISPSAAQYEETLTTLHLASLVKKIHTFPVKNEDIKSVSKKQLEGNRSASKATLKSENDINSISKNENNNKNKEEESSLTPKTYTINVTPKTSEENSNGPSISFLSPQKTFPKPNKLSRSGIIANEKLNNNNSRKDQKNIGFRKEDSSKIIRRLAHVIRFLQSEITKKVILYSFHCA